MALLGDDFFRPENTAIRRREPSPFARQLVGSDYLNSNNVQTILDYGCGVGADVGYYRLHGFIADGYDPHRPFGWSEPVRCSYYDLTVCLFVLNVIADSDLRRGVVDRLRSHTKPGGLIFVAARSAICIEGEARRKGWQAYKDGYISSIPRKTFQKGFTEAELAELFSSGFSFKRAPLKGRDFSAIILQSLAPTAI